MSQCSQASNLLSFLYFSMLNIVHGENRIFLRFIPYEEEGKWFCKGTSKEEKEV